MKDRKDETGRTDPVCAVDAPRPAHGGCKAKSCTGRAPEEELPAAIREKVRRHPCYSEEAHHHYARMHVAVAPACNIQCNYCNRKYDCANESRPGVVSERLTPSEAVTRVAAVAAAIPQLSVVGIAGPGDPLANPAKTFATLRGVAQMLPDVQLCLSTNGLALPDQVDEIARLNVHHVTITINAVDPAIAARIYPWIFFGRRRIRGLEAAKILCARQMEGLRMLAARGILCKINSVLIPGLNDDHLVEVNRAVKARGAFLHNIMPLISAPEHGTVFGLSGQRAPTARELKAVQDQCEGGVGIMRHCRQCRADAVGLLGEDRSAEFTREKIQGMAVRSDPAARRMVQARIEEERTQNAAHATSVSGRADRSVMQAQVAVATSGGQRINTHFGRAREFQIYAVDRDGLRFMGHRRIDRQSRGEVADDEALRVAVTVLNDCHAVLATRIGGYPREELRRAGIEAIETVAGGLIPVCVRAWFQDYARRVARGETQHKSRGDAPLRIGAYVVA